MCWDQAAECPRTQARTSLVCSTIMQLIECSPDVPAWCTWPLHVEPEVSSPQAYERVCVCVSLCAGRINVYEAIYRIHANGWTLNSPHSHVLKRHVLTHACAYGRHSTHIELHACLWGHACMYVSACVCMFICPTGGQHYACLRDLNKTSRAAAIESMACWTCRKVALFSGEKHLRKKAKDWGALVFYRGHTTTPPVPCARST